MATGWSTSQRRQASSQPWGQMRPSTPGKGSSFKLTLPKASAVVESA